MVNYESSLSPLFLDCTYLRYKLVIMKLNCKLYSNWFWYELMRTVLFKFTSVLVRILVWNFDSVDLQAQRLWQKLEHTFYFTNSTLVEPSIICYQSYYCHLLVVILRKFVGVFIIKDFILKTFNSNWIFMKNMHRGTKLCEELYSLVLILSTIHIFPYYIFT